MSCRTEDTWEHSVHVKRLLAKFVSIWVDIVREQLVYMYMDASILVVGVLALKVKSEFQLLIRWQKKTNDCHNVLPLYIYSKVWPGFVLSQ